LIGGSVGKGGRNKLNDVRAVQTLLNLPINMSLSGLKAPLETDGMLGKSTQDAIDLYQEKVMKPRKGQADWRLDRGRSMICKLEQAFAGRRAGGCRPPPNGRLLQVLRTGAAIPGAMKPQESSCAGKGPPIGAKRHVLLDRFRKGPAVPFRLSLLMQFIGCCRRGFFLVLLHPGWCGGTFGALDMAGNVAEWTSTVTPSSGMGGFFIRGGSYRVDELVLPDSLDIRVDESTSSTDISWDPFVGVRCAKDL
jgi:hypothetical protein